MLDNIVIYYQNCRGIRTKLHILYMSILSNCYDIIILTETWLTPEIFDNEFIDNRYLVYRCDRDRTATNKKDGGGVLVAVLKGLRSVRIIPSPTLESHIEFVFLKFPGATRGKNHIIGASYIPPRTPECIYIQYFDLLQNLLDDANVEYFHLLGDYNLPDIDWIPFNNSILPSSGFICRGTSQVCGHLGEFMSCLNASQYNSIRNPSGKLLDLAISNSECSVFPPTDYLLQLDNHHPPFCTLIPFKLTHAHMIRKSRKKYNYFRANYEKINEELSDINWNEQMGKING